MRYFGIWVDELRKTHEEPDETARIWTSMLIHSSPHSSRQVSPFLQATKALRESRGIALLYFQTSALEEGEGSASRPRRFLPPGKTRYLLYRRLDGYLERSGRQNISPHRDSIPGPSSPQPVAIPTELPAHPTFSFSSEKSPNLCRKAFELYGTRGSSVDTVFIGRYINSVFAVQKAKLIRRMFES